MRHVIALLAMGGCRINFETVLDASDDANDGRNSDAFVATSCKGLAATCGSATNQSCCDSLPVTGGMFFRSHDVAADMLYADTSGPATVSDFRLDTYEVTVGRFRLFVLAGQGSQVAPPLAGAGAHPNIANSGWVASWNPDLAVDTATLMAALNCNTYRTWTDTVGPNENKPITCLDWYDAMAFCAWDGGFLPTEAEWNYAAAGGSEQRAFPWSNPPGSIAISCSDATYGGQSFPTTACVSTGVAPAGASPSGQGAWGHLDLAGNAREWVLDAWTQPYPVPCINCAPVAGTDRVIRGGGFDSSEVNLRTGLRIFGPQTVRNDSNGVRCARYL